MANPPITIGPFTNVPAPGSPIKSDWPQQITTYVVNAVSARPASNAIEPLSAIVPVNGLRAAFGTWSAQIDGAYFATLPLGPAAFPNGLASFVAMSGDHNAKFWCNASMAGSSRNQLQVNCMAMGGDVAPGSVVRIHAIAFGW